MSSKGVAGVTVTEAKGNVAPAELAGQGDLRPLIGLPGRRRRADEVAGFPDSMAGLPLDVYLAGYSRAVAAAGGLPVNLPVDVDPLPYLARLDGIVLTGGADVEPGHYGSDPDGHGSYEPERDRFELALAAGALERALPVLAICRGLQVLNVVVGGSLTQDVAAHARYDLDPARPAHEVGIEPGTRLHQLYGVRLGVNSLHHQCIERLGSGLVVSARADDGTVEGVEMPGRDVLGVQWHPEMHPGPEPVFDWLVGRALSFARSRARA